MEQQDKANELSELRTRVERLEEELADDKMQWPPQSYYTAYHVLAGFVLGMFGAATSLLFNIVGSLIVGQYPLRLIQVYLTFPMGEAALSMDSGLALAIGCCLYMGTGMCYGIVFHLVLSRWFEKSDIRRRLVVVSLLGIALWLVNFSAS